MDEINKPSVERSRRKKGRRHNPYYAGPASNHFDGTRFFNPDGVGPGQFRDLLRWQLGGGRSRWPKAVDLVAGTARPAEQVDGAELVVTMVGHATMLIQTCGLNILTDPVWSERVSPFFFAGPKRVSRPGITYADLPPIDLVLVSHSHYDHLDVHTLKRLHADHRPRFVTPLGNDTIIRKAAPGAEVTVLDWGDGVDLGGGIAVHAEPAHHWSARGTFDRCMALWAAFVIATPHGRIYHVGDTGFHDGHNYRQAKRKYGAFRLAILPIGAYEPRWFMKSQHQNPEEAVRGMQLCGAHYAIGHHFAAFQLTNEAIGAPVEALKAALLVERIEADRFRALLPGQTFQVPQTE